MKFMTTTDRLIEIDVVVVGWDGKIVNDDKPGNWRIVIDEDGAGILFDETHARAFAAGILAACDEIDARAKGP